LLKFRECRRLRLVLLKWVLTGSMMYWILSSDDC
jgi:hypothetical protein